VSGQEPTERTGAEWRDLERIVSLKEDVKRLEAELVAQRDVVARLEQRLMVAWTEDEYFQEIERLRDVVADILAYCDSCDEHGGMPSTVTIRKISGAAAVVSGTPEESL
jgi:hypothetical protein